MNAIFLQVLNMSLTAGFVIATIMLARLFLKKAPQAISYALWTVAGFRLLFPFSFESIFSLIPFEAEPVTNIVSNNVGEPIEHIISSPDWAPSVEIGSISNAMISTPTDVPMYFWLHLAGEIWLIGIAVMLIYSLLSLLRLRRKLVGAVRLRENIYLADHIVTPFVVGVMRPKIYLPSTLSEREQDYIILHERTHIRRLDHIVKLVSFLALSIHWFNPLVWVAFVLSGKDMEMSCDEAVMKKMDGDIRVDYSALLLSLATGRRIFAGAPLAFGEGDTKSRIKNVMNYKKPAFWIVAAAVVVCIVLAVCLIANPHHKEVIMVNNTLYERDDEVLNELPANSYEIGMLESVLHDQRSVPERNFQGVGLDEKYAGNRLYRSGINNVTIYLEDFSGFYIPFIAQQSDWTGSSDWKPQPEYENQDDYLRALDAALQSVKTEKIVVDDKGSNEQTAQAWMEAWLDMYKELPEDNMAHISDGAVDSLQISQVSKEGLPKAFIFSVTVSVRPTYPIASNGFWMAGNTGNSPGRDETWGQLSREVELRQEDDGRYHFVSIGTGGAGDPDIYDMVDNVGAIDEISGLFSYSVSDIEKIEFQDGNTGRLASFTDESEINDIIEHLNAFRYDQIEPVASSGWTYAIRLWFKDDSDMQRITLTPSSASIDGNHYISSEHEYFPQEWLEQYRTTATLFGLQFDTESAEIKAVVRKGTDNEDEWVRGDMLSEPAKKALGQILAMSWQTTDEGTFIKKSLNIPDYSIEIYTSAGGIELNLYGKTSDSGFAAARINDEWQRYSVTVAEYDELMKLFGLSNTEQ